MTIIWHNPRCSKSRQTLAILKDRGIEPAERLYLIDGPTADEIRAVLAMLKREAIEIVRTKDALFKELGLTKLTSADDLITAMVKNPALIERPIVIANGKAAIGRPPEAVLDII